MHRLAPSRRNGLVWRLAATIVLCGISQTIASGESQSTVTFVQPDILGPTNDHAALSDFNPLRTVSNAILRKTAGSTPREAVSGEGNYRPTWGQGQGPRDGQSPANPAGSRRLDEQVVQAAHHSQRSNQLQLRQDPRGPSPSIIRFIPRATKSLREMARSEIPTEQSVSQVAARQEPSGDEATPPSGKDHKNPLADIPIFHRSTATTDAASGDEPPRRTALTRSPVAAGHPDDRNPSKVQHAVARSASGRNHRYVQPSEYVGPADGMRSVLVEKQRGRVTPARRVVATPKKTRRITTSSARSTPAAEQAVKLVTLAHEQSQSAETEEHYTTIIATCRRALAVAPEGEVADYAKELVGWALNRRGQAKADAGRPNEAMLDFDDAIQSDSNCWRAVHNRGVLLAQAGHLEQAFDDFNLTTQLNPTFAKAYANRAALFVLADDLYSALRDYRQAIDLDPNLMVAHKGRGRLCHMLGNFPEAMQHFDAAAQLAPEDADVAATRADLLTDMGRYQEAIDEYERALALDPELAHAYRSVAWLRATCPQAHVRDTDQALQDAITALEIAGTEDHVGLDTLAAAHANAGDFQSAVEAEARAIASAPDAERGVYQARLRLYEQSTPYRISPIRQAQDYRPIAR